MRNKILILITSVIISSCATISYTPRVSLDVSPETINKSVKVENLYDKVTAKQKEKPVGGYSVTDPESLVGELSVEVTNAIIADFNTNRVFSKISKTVDNPDLLLKGEIIRLEGKYKPTAVFWVTLPVTPLAFLWFFGLPIMKDLVDIEIRLSIYESTGELIGEYTGKSYDTKLYTMYKSGTLGLPAKTNKIFSAAIKDIRKQILKDSKKFK